MTHNTQLVQLVANNIRVLAAEGVEKAKSGHPGMPMGAADYAALLWSEFLRFDPGAPEWPNRDRFVLSAGHGSMLLYSLLHLFGFDLPMSELQSFRQWGSKTPGHPEFGVTPGVETTTGPLGQGFGNGVGLALSGKLLSARYSSTLFNYRVFGIVSDGDLMEGVASEAASMAGHLGLDNLIYIYDDNEISIGGSTDVCFTESVTKRFDAYGWHVIESDGHDIDQLRQALQKACAHQGQPKLIVARTTIGRGSPHKAGDAEVHGAPLGAEELQATKNSLQWPNDKSFCALPDVRSFCAQSIENKKQERAAWEKDFESWRQAHPDQCAHWELQNKRELPSQLQHDLLAAFDPPKKDATRNLSGKAIQVIAKHVPFFIGGSADLEPSTKTLIKDSSDIQRAQFSGRNIRFGVREHGMGALVNGLAYTQAWIPFSATFLVFADYMRPAIRLAALSHLQSLFIFTHDSFWVGEDGPTHQPIEHIASLRLIPNLKVFRPADGVEVAMCYLVALESKNSPSVLLFTRQDVTPLTRPAGFSPDDIRQGAYTVQELAGTTTAPLFVIVATGSEVQVALDAARLVNQSGHSVRVVSMPCQELFLQQPRTVQESIIPAQARRISLEAGSTIGWERIIGSDGLRLGIDHYGASAPGAVLAEKFGFTPQQVGEKILSWCSAAGYTGRQ